jgi:hypothetical protein
MRHGGVVVSVVVKGNGAAAGEADCQQHLQLELTSLRILSSPTL